MSLWLCRPPGLHFDWGPSWLSLFPTGFHIASSRTCPFPAISEERHNPESKPHSTAFHPPLMAVLQQTLRMRFRLCQAGYTAAMLALPAFSNTWINALVLIKNFRPEKKPGTILFLINRRVVASGIIPFRENSRTLSKVFKFSCIFRFSFLPKARCTKS